MALTIAVCLLPVVAQRFLSMTICPSESDRVSKVSSLAHIYLQASALVLIWETSWGLCPRLEARRLLGSPGAGSGLPPTVWQTLPYSTCCCIPHVPLCNADVHAASQPTDQWTDQWLICSLAWPSTSLCKTTETCFEATDSTTSLVICSVLECLLCVMIQWPIFVCVYSALSWQIACEFANS